MSEFYEPVQRRRNQRVDQRVKLRNRGRSPHERYHVPPHLIPPGMVVEFKALQVFGKPNVDRMREYVSNGWQPARAEDFPDFSGYGQAFSPAVMAMGGMTEIKPDDPVIISGQILMIRPQEYSEEAIQEGKEAAQRQMSDQFATLTHSSRQNGYREVSIKRDYE